MTSLLSIREGESGSHKEKDSSTKALLYQKVNEAEVRFNRSMNAVEESPVIISPHGLNPKVKRLVLRNDSLTIIGFKTGKINKQWRLEDIVKVKRHSLNHACFTITCLERKKRKVKNQRYSFEVKGELECWHWIEVLNAAMSNALKEQNNAEVNAAYATSKNNTLSPSGGGTLTRSRSTSAPPAMEPLQRTPVGKNSRAPILDDDSDDDEHDPYADPYDDSHTDDEDSLVSHKEKEAEPHERRNHSVTFKPTPDVWTQLNSNAPSSGSQKDAFNPFASTPQYQPASQSPQPINPYTSHQQMYMQPQQQPSQFQKQQSLSAPLQPQQQTQLHQQNHSPVSSPAPSVVLSPPTSQGAVMNAPLVYITTMSPPAHMRILQDLGLLSATGTVAAPQNPAQCGAQVEAALQAARLELAQRAGARGANAVFQTSFSTSFHQWGVTVLACGTACTATMIAH